jgi:membrane protease YdiL (CAAX protease family)
MNQFLIFAGNKLFAILQFSDSYEILIVGIFQQVVQITLAIVLGQWLVGKDVAIIGINTQNVKQTFRYIGIFVLAILTIILLYLFISRQFIPNLWQEMRYAKIPEPAGIATKLFFQSIFPGLGEELLFRGFLISLFIKKLNLNIDRTGSKILVSVISALFFSIAHIYFQLMPLQIVHIDVTQLLLAFFCGIFYSLMFINTKSLLGPVVSHNFSNVSMTIAGYIIAVI